MLYTTEIINEIDKKYLNGEKLKRSEKIYHQNKFGYRKSFLTFNMTTEELNEWSKSCHDIFYFIKNVCGINLYDFQKEMIQNFKETRFNVNLISRQIGNSTIQAILVLHQLLFSFDKNILIFDKSNRIYSILCDLYLKLPFYLKVGLLMNKSFILSENDCKITFIKKNLDLWLKNKYENRNFINDLSCVTEDEDKNYDIVFINELSYVTEQNTIINLFPLIATTANSKIFVSSLPNGLNHFYDFFQNADRYSDDPKKNIFKANRIYWWQVPDRDEKWKQEKIKQIGESKFNEEYDLSFKSKI